MILISFVLFQGAKGYNGDDGFDGEEGLKVMIIHWYFFLLDWKQVNNLKQKIAIIK